MLDILRDSTFGQIVNAASNGRFFSYPEERPDYQVPVQYLATHSRLPMPATNTYSSDNTLVNEKARPAISAIATPEPAALNDAQRRASSGALSEATLTVSAPASPKITKDRLASYLSEDRFGHSHDAEVVDEVEKAKAAAMREQGGLCMPRTKSEEEFLLVDWDGEEDQDNPQNWSTLKKSYVTFSISLLTFSVYAGSSMYTTSIPGLIEAYGSSLTVAELGLFLFIFGYGVGPMILSPLQEFPKWGRNPVYIISLGLYLLFNLGSALGQNMATVLVMRFLSGFFGSPALATGGATIQDIWPMTKLPYMIALWAIGAVCGPSFAPLIGGFAAQYEGWRWPMWILVWLAGFAWVFLFFTLPETMGSNILHKRAARLRKVTGNKNISTLGERDQEKMTKSEIIYDALARPIRLGLEPAVFFVNLYLGIVYGIFYLFFESWPLVFGDIYGFDLSQQGLAFLGITVCAPITYTIYALYNKYYIDPRWIRENGSEPEVKLEIGMWAGIIIPIAQLWWGWSARESVHWVVPIIGSALYLPGIFMIFQSFLTYLPMSYSKYAASVLAVNDLVRSTIASVFPLFGRAFYNRLGLGGGSSLLAGLSIALLPGMVLLRIYGKNLRARSKFTDYNPTNSGASTPKETDAASRV